MQRDEHKSKAQLIKELDRVRQQLAEMQAAAATPRDAFFDTDSLRQRQLVQADKMASLGILVSGVAHEINNPNALIMASMAVLEDVWRYAHPVLDRHVKEQGDFKIAKTRYSVMRDKIPELISSALEGAERIRLIVQELRAYSRDDPVAPMESININRVVQSGMTLLAPMIKRHTDCFTVQYGGNGTLPRVRGNPQRLEQVIINLVQNACQSLTSREKALRVSTALDEAEQAIVVQVQDEGHGIPLQDLPHITEPFFTTKRDCGGTGLGLSISSGIVESHNGRLEFSSNIGQGTVACIILPAEESARKSRGEH